MGDTHYCNRCGEEYDTSLEAQNPPEEPSIYWVPKCPECNAKITDTAIDETWLNIRSDGLNNHNYSDEEKRQVLREIHYQARLFHGRVTDLSKEELIERAKYFDSRILRHPGYGVSSERDIAFRLRKQARNM